MTDVKTLYLALLTRTRLAQMLTETYAKARNVDPDESYARLDEALKSLRLISGLQNATWVAMQDIRPDLPPDKLVARAETALARRKNFKAFRIRRNEEGSFAAVTILIELGAGVSTGEALGLLESDEGEALLQAGFQVLGRHLAAVMLKPKA